LKSKSKNFSPTHFSPTRDRDFSPTKKPRLALVKPSKNGQRGRPRNPESPPTPGKYFYWTKARNGLKLERRKPEYEYIGFITPNEWEHSRGNFNEEYILFPFSGLEMGPQIGNFCSLRPFDFGIPKSNFEAATFDFGNIEIKYSRRTY
jgi:hypothetical protein